MMVLVVMVVLVVVVLVMVVLVLMVAVLVVVVLVPVAALYAMSWVLKAGSSWMLVARLDPDASKQGHHLSYVMLIDTPFLFTAMVA